MSKVMESMTTFGEPTVVITLTIPGRVDVLYRAVPTYGKGNGTWFTKFSEALAEARESWESEARSYTRKSRGLDTANSMLAEIDRLYAKSPRLLV
mgnify:CR=1 FL=1